LAGWQARMPYRTRTGGSAVVLAGARRQAFPRAGRAPNREWWGGVGNGQLRAAPPHPRPTQLGPSIHIARSYSRPHPRHGVEVVPRGSAWERAEVGRGRLCCFAVRRRRMWYPNGSSASSRGAMGGATPPCPCRAGLTTGQTPTQATTAEACRSASSKCSACRRRTCSSAGTSAPSCQTRGQ
jgi:hypothetical protein